jgi:AsmA protein
MGRMLKIFFYIVSLSVLLGVVAIVTVMVLFDVNDYREEIELVVEKNTGREFVIDGEIGLAVFPWLAIEIPHTRLGNGAGFGDEPFASFDEANLSVRLMPLLLRREVQVTTAELVGLRLNLAVNSDGRSNWQDFIDASEAMDAMPAEEQSGTDTVDAALNVAGIEILNSAISYVDAQAGSNIKLSDLNIVIGDISSEAGTIHLDGFSIEALLEGVAETPTTFGLKTASVDLNTESESIALATVELAMLGLDISAEVEPLSYAGDISPVAAIQVDPFSLRNLMQRLDIEAPETTDPTALGKVSIDATAKVTPTAIVLTNLTLVLDDTTLKGELSIPQGNADIYRLDLKANEIDLDRYMAPVAEGAGSSDSSEVPIEIPTDMIRLINARGKLTLDSVHLSGLEFADVTLGLVTDNGVLRLHPFSATLFEGQYQGDIQIDASADTPVISANERIEGVQLGALALAMFEQDNISGTINGTFKLSGRGADLAAIQRDLGGSISLELIDGAYEGTDVWYELRKARAALRQEEAPEPNLPARTQFSEVSASGPVVNGIFANDNLLVELPFMQITGKGSVNFVDATMDYRMSARVFDKPEFIGDDVTADELKDFTKTVIPMRVTGPLTAPSIKPDVQKLLQDAVKKEIEEKLKDEIGDKLGDKLKDLLKL